MRNILHIIDGRTTQFRQPGVTTQGLYTGTKLYCLLTETHGCEQLDQGLLPHSAVAGNWTLGMRLSCNFVNMYAKQLLNVYTNVAENNKMQMVLSYSQSW